MNVNVNYKVQITFKRGGFEECLILDPQPSEEAAVHIAETAMKLNRIIGAEIWVLPPGSKFWKIRDSQGRMVQRPTTEALNERAE